jgi:hypothetical protein
MGSESPSVAQHANREKLSSYDFGLTATGKMLFSCACWPNSFWPTYTYTPKVDDDDEANQFSFANRETPVLTAGVPSHLGVNIGVLEEECYPFFKLQPHSANSSQQLPKFADMKASLPQPFSPVRPILHHVSAIGKKRALERNQTPLKKTEKKGGGGKGRSYTKKALFQLVREKKVTVARLRYG